MEVRIGVMHAPREITFESHQSADEIASTVREALAADARVIEFTDDKGGRVIVPTGALAYVSTSGERRAGVGFGAV